MDRTLGDAERRLSDGLGHCRMGVAGTGEILRGAAELHKHRGFMNHLAGAKAHDMDAKHSIRRSVSKEFDEAVSLAHRARPTIRREGKLTDIVGDAGALKVFFGLAHRSDLRRSVDDGRNDVVIHVAVLAGENFRDGDAFIFAFVREHWPTDDVADRVNPFDIGTKMFVDDHLTALGLDADGVQPKSLGERTTADGDKGDVCLHGDRIAALGRLDRRDDAFSDLVDLGDFMPEMEFEILLLEQALELFGDLPVHPRQDTVEKFDHGHLSAETRPNRAKLEANNAGADDEQLGWWLIERERARRGDDLLLVDLDARQTRDIGTGGDDDRLGLERRRLAIFASDVDLARRDDAR